MQLLSREVRLGGVRRLGEQAKLIGDERQD